MISRMRIWAARLPASLTYLCGKLIYGVGQVALIRVLTSTLDPTALGTYYLLLSGASLFSLTLIHPVSMYITRQFVGWQQDGTAWARFRSFLPYLGMVALAAAAAGFGLRSLGGWPLPAALLVLLPALVLFTATATLPTELFNLAGRFGLFNVMVNLELWGRVAVLFAVQAFLPRAALPVLGGLAVWAALVSVVSLVALRRITRREGAAPAAPTEWREVVGYAWPFAVSVGLYWCQSDGYRLVLQRVADLEAVGRFVVAFNLGATLMVAFDSLVNQIALPRYYGSIADAGEAGYRRAWEDLAGPVASALVAVALFLACAGPFLARWILHAEYWSLGAFAAFGALAQLFRALSSLLSVGIFAYRQTRTLLLPNLVGAAVVLSGVYLLGRQHALLGTGTALVLAFLAAAFAMAKAFRAMSGARLPLRAMSRAALWMAPICAALVLLAGRGFARDPLWNPLILAGAGLALAWVLLRTAPGIFTARA